MEEVLVESHGRLAVGWSCGSRGPGSQLKEVLGEGLSDVTKCGALNQ